MQLSGPQVKQIHAAILDGYSLDTLRMMVRIELGESLEAIAGPGALSVVTFSLIEWAERTGRVQDLINGALAQQPGNALIHTLHEQAKGWGLAAPGGRPTTAERGQGGPGATFDQRDQQVDTQTNVAGDLIHGDKAGGDKVGGNKYTAEHITIVQGGAAEARATPDVPTAPAKASPIAFEWVTVRAGHFLMGDKDEHCGGRQDRIYVPAFRISKYPVTNAQYEMFVDATGYATPTHWQHGQIPKGKENHPVVSVTWHDVMAFCHWAGVRLPTEAEWEKAARGTDGRIYPWGDKPPTEKLCNFGRNVGDTTPVGRYSPQGDSPYGVADMAGNVWEWTSSKFLGYPYDPDDGRESPEGNDVRALRGGAWAGSADWVRCAYRLGFSPDFGYVAYGFRVVWSPGF